MELGLSLGDSTASSKPKRPRAGVVGLGFCMALGINSNGLRPYDLQKSNEENNDDHDNSSSEDTIRDDDIDQRLHLHLLPPSINYRSQISLRCSSDNGSSDNASSGNVHGKENGLNNSNSRKKLRLSKEQSAHLEVSFKEHNTLNPKQKHALAKQLNLRPRQVEVWFQNRRARTKLKQTEVDYEYMKSFCETLREENRRLQKELGELRAFKTSNPFYMQLPATTLTMCPSCERVATTTSTLPSTAAAAATATDCIPTAIPFPTSRPRLYPFCHTTNHPHQSPPSN